MSAPEISIIIPVYNAEKYLRTCLQSIVAQTFTDWECILIDDGSRDWSGFICDSYAARDPRFRVIHQMNSGVSAARNAGLDAARGAYIAFIDPDDFINEVYLQELRNCITGHDICAATINATITLPLSTIEYRMIPKEQQERDGVILFEEDGCVKGSFEYENNEDTAKTIYVWGRLYRSEIIGNQRFDCDLRSGEDTLFSLEIFNKTSNFGFARSAKYFYEKRVGGLSSQINTDMGLEIDEKIVAFFAAHPEMLKGDREQHWLDEVLDDVCSCILFSKKRSKREKDMFWKILRLRKEYYEDL